MLSQFQVPWDVKFLYLHCCQKEPDLLLAPHPDRPSTDTSKSLSDSHFLAKLQMAIACWLSIGDLALLPFAFPTPDGLSRPVGKTHFHSESRARQQSWLAWLWHCLPFFLDCTCATESIEGSRTASLNSFSYLVITRSENMSTALAYWCLKAELNGYLSKSECHTWGDL